MELNLERQHVYTDYTAVAEGYILPPDEAVAAAASDNVNATIEVACNGSHTQCPHRPVCTAID